MDGGVFLLDNGIPMERIHFVCGEGLTLTMKNSHYLVSTSFGLHYRAMCTVHAVLDTGAWPNLTRSDVFPIVWRQNLVTSAHILWFDGANSSPLQLMIIVFLRLKLGNYHLQVPFITTYTWIRP